MLKTKFILAPKEASDGKRISIMFRHSLEDGVTPHPAISSDSYDEWLKILAPPEKLAIDYSKKIMPWEEFEKRYLYYLRTPDVQDAVKNLARKSLDSTTTILCFEGSPKKSYRRLLAEECRRYQSALEVVIK